MKNFENDDQLKKWLSSYRRKKPSEDFVDNVMKTLEHDPSVLYRKKFNWQLFWSNFLTLFFPMAIILAALGYYFYSSDGTKISFQFNFTSFLSLINSFMNEIVHILSSNPFVFIAILALVLLLFIDKIINHFIHSL